MNDDATEPRPAASVRSSNARSALARASDELGYDEFTDEQREAILALWSGRDVLAVLPTGSGKSAIYQAAAEGLDGPSVVVAPLLALQQDQQRHVRARGLSRAARVTGSTSPNSRRTTLAAFEAGEVEYLFVTPETLGADDVLAAAARAHVSLLVVDEAHCVVTWGQGFRPAFGRLGELRRNIGDPTTVALTASADRRLRDDVGRSLGLHDPLEVVATAVRPEIELAVHLSHDPDAAMAALVDCVGRGFEKTIVYVPRRRIAEELAAEIADLGRPARAFHGGLRSTVRKQLIEWFRSHDGAVMVATEAFGMGIDVPDIGAVLHLDLPATLVDLYQEVGRGGRDGRRVRATAFVAADRTSRRRFSGGAANLDRTVCEAVATSIRAGATSRRTIRAATGASANEVTGALAVLESIGVVEVARPISWSGPDDDVVDSEALTDACRRRDEFHRSQLDAVTSYVVGNECRWVSIAAALGESTTPCGRCDVCHRRDDRSAPVDDAWTGLTVEHPEFGPGRVTSDDGTTVSISFADAGPKRFDRAVLATLDGLVVTTPD